MRQGALQLDNLITLVRLEAGNANRASLSYRVIPAPARELRQNRDKGRTEFLCWRGVRARSSGSARSLKLTPRCDIMPFLSAPPPVLPCTESLMGSHTAPEIRFLCCGFLSVLGGEGASHLTTILCRPVLVCAEVAAV